MGKILFIGVATLIAFIAVGVLLKGNQEELLFGLRELFDHEVYLKYFIKQNLAGAENAASHPENARRQEKNSILPQEEGNEQGKERVKENGQSVDDGKEQPLEEQLSSTHENVLERGKEEKLNVKENVEIPKGHMKKLGEHKDPEPPGAIEILDYIPNGKDFYTHFIRKRRPLLMKGAAASWPAVKNWHNEKYLKDKYGEVIFDVEFRKVQSAAEYPVKKTMAMKEFLRLYKDTPVYLDSPFPQSNLTEDLVVPFCMQCEEISSKFRSVHLLFSSGGTSSAFHQDGYENLLTMVSGRKEVVAINYTYSEDLYADEFETVPGLSPIHPEHVDLLKFPKVANVPFHKIILEPGDILYIPQHWWHQVRSYGSPNIGVSIWFHQFESSDQDEEQTSEEDFISYREVLKEDKRFINLVEKYPHTIECRNQNRPITEVFRPDKDWDTPEEEDLNAMYTTLIGGYQMPMLGLGTGFLLGEELKVAATAALENGYRLFDTAQAYQNEETLGEVLSKSKVPRSDLFIVSKIHPRFLGFNSTLVAIQDSLNKLKVDYLDLMLIHSMDCDEGPNARLKCEPGEPEGTWEDTWKAMEMQVKMGKLRSIGVSNFEVSDLEKLLSIATIHPSVVQNFFDPFSQDREVREFCDQHSIRYMGFSNLGALYQLDMDFTYNPVTSHKVLKEIARKYDVSVQQLVTAWALQEDVLVIPRSKNPDHIVINFEAQHLRLSEEDFEFIHNLDGQLTLPDDDHINEFTGEPSPVQEDETDKAGGESIPEQDGETEGKGDGQEQASQLPAAHKDKLKDFQVIVKKTVNPDEPTVFISSDDHWVYALDAITGELMWKYETADETGSTLVFNHDGSVIYFGADDQHIRAVQTADGTLLWKFQTDGAVTSSIKVADDGSLYVGCLDHHIYALTSDGVLKWKKNLGNEVWSSPALLDGGRVVYIGSMAEESSNLFAFNGSTGDVIWSYQAHGPIFSTPAVNSDGRTVIVCSFDANCYGFTRDTGHIAWVFHGDGPYQSSPVVSQTDSVFYVASIEGTVYAISATSGEKIWENKGHGEIFSSPYVAFEKVFIGTGTGDLLALHQTNGSTLWSYRTLETIWSSPRATQAGIVYIGGIDGDVYALKENTGELVWSFKTDGPVVATPLITKSFAYEVKEYKRAP